MRILAKLLKWLAALVVVLAAGAAGWLYFSPPALIRVGTAYTAKIVCSNQFLAWRDGREVLALDVQAPGHPLLKYISIDVDTVARTVSAKLFGLFGEGRAVYRRGAGCTSVPHGTEAQAIPAVPEAGVPDMASLWPLGERVEPSQDPALAAILDDPEMTGPGMRAVVVAHNGRIVGERYGAGFKEDTPLLGWSMTKTVTAAIIGTLITDRTSPEILGLRLERKAVLSIDQDELFEEWTADGRASITLADLLAMSSGLEFNEDYGDVTDVTRMLYLESDMSTFAAGKPPAGPRGEVFSYSSGTTVMLSRIWQTAFGNPAAALAWPRRVLFGPLGMASAVMETDASGTFVGSSYLYATARDWARFGEFLRNDGAWNGQQVLPEGFAAWMREPAPASGGAYGRGQLWLRGPGEGGDAGFDLPQDAFWLLGHDGQSTVVIPSRGLVVVRMGLTPSRLGYKPQRMAQALARLYAGEGGGL